MIWMLIEKPCGWVQKIYFLTQEEAIKVQPPYESLSYMYFLCDFQYLLFYNKRVKQNTRLLKEIRFPTYFILYHIDESISHGQIQGSQEMFPLPHSRKKNSVQKRNGAFSFISFECTLHDKCHLDLTPCSKHVQNNIHYFLVGSTAL